MLERSARPALGGVPDSGLQSRGCIAGLPGGICAPARNRPFLADYWSKPCGHGV